MTPRYTVLFAAAAALSLALARPAAPAHPSFAGTWTLDREHSEFPKEVGFDVKVGVPGRDDDASGRARGGGGGGLPGLVRLESEQDGYRRTVLAEEVRTPPATLTIAETATTITFSLPQQPDRVFHPAGEKERESDEAQSLPAGHVIASAKWIGAVLEVRYDVAKDLVLRYRYSRVDDRAPLVVEATLLNKNKGGVIRRVYTGAHVHKPS